MNREEEKFRKAVEELRDSYELHLRRWAERCLQDIEIAYEKEKEENMSYYYHIQGLEDDIRMHYISTYKIEKEIKKIKDSNTYRCEEWNDRDVVELLKNLISKEE